MDGNTEVRERLVRIEAKLDRALTDLLDHERRLRRVERVAYTAAGIATAGSALAGALGALAH